jgi:hypothetical protein
MNLMSADAGTGSLAEQLQLLLERERTANAVLRAELVKRESQGVVLPVLLTVWV